MLLQTILPIQPKRSERFSSLTILTAFLSLTFLHSSPQLWPRPLSSMSLCNHVILHPTLRVVITCLIFLCLHYVTWRNILQVPILPLIKSPLLCKGRPCSSVSLRSSFSNPFIHGPPLGCVHESTSAIKALVKEACRCLCEILISSLYPQKRRYCFEFKSHTHTCLFF